MKRRIKRMEIGPKFKKYLHTKITCQIIKHFEMEKVIIHGIFIK
jgi:hypothetical protein